MTGAIVGLTTAQWLTLAVFTATIVSIVVNKLDASALALLGVVVLIWLGTMTDVEAANLVDWNVMAILIGIWIIAGYFGRTGVPSWLSVQSLKLSGGRPGLLVLVLSMLTGLLSMFIDNVVCILMMAPVALPLARALGIPATPLVLMIGFSANFMGTALLLGYSRIPYAAARDGYFFAPFGRLHPTGGFPALSLVVLGVIAIAACAFSLGIVIDALIATRILVQFIGQIAAVAYLRRTRPEMPRPYRIWLYPLPALLALAGWTFIFLTTDTRIIGFGLGLLALGVLCFFVWSRNRRT